MAFIILLVPMEYLIRREDGAVASRHVWLGALYLKTSKAIYPASRCWGWMLIHVAAESSPSVEDDRDSCQLEEEKTPYSILPIINPVLLELLTHLHGIFMSPTDGQLPWWKYLMYEFHKWWTEVRSYRGDPDPVHIAIASGTPEPQYLPTPVRSIAFQGRKSFICLENN